jgi:hypothetical protein
VKVKPLSEQLNGSKVEKYRYIDRLNEGIGLIDVEQGETIQYVREDLGDHVECHLVHSTEEGIRKIVKVSELETIVFAECEPNNGGR